MKLNYCHLVKPKRSRFWQLRWKVEGQKATSKSLRVRDKRAAEKMLSDFRTEFEREAIGIIPAKNLREGSQMSLETLLRAYLADLSIQKCAPKYVSHTGRCIEIVAKAKSWQTVRDISGEGFTSWRSRQGELAPKTLNIYLGCLLSFCNWLVDTERLAENPLRRVAKVKDHTKRLVRRAITDSEIERLLSVAPAERRIIYMIALHTGLRRSEIESLEWRDVLLDQEPPSIRLRGATTKNRKGDGVTLHPELVDALRSHRGDAAPETSKVVSMFDKLTQFKKDLKAAGIPYRDEQGRIFDLHSMRVTFNTRLAVHGVPTRIAMQAMRHSDEKLTTRVYTDTALLPLAAQISALPSLLGKAEVSHRVSHGLETKGNAETQTDTQGEWTDAVETLQERGFAVALTRSEPWSINYKNGARCRVRTCDPIRVKDVLYH